MPIATLNRPETNADKKTTRYPLYKVLCHNDDVTTMDFVIFVLHRIFGLAIDRAHNVMLEVHHTGVALVGAFTMEQAEFRIDQTHSLARAHKFPLKLTMEPE